MHTAFFNHYFLVFRFPIICVDVFILTMKYIKTVLNLIIAFDLNRKNTIHLHEIKILKFLSFTALNHRKLLSDYKNKID